MTLCTGAGSELDPEPDGERPPRAPAVVIQKRPMSQIRCSSFSKSATCPDAGLQTQCVCSHKYFAHKPLSAPSQPTAPLPQNLAAARITSFAASMIPVAPAHQGGRQEHYTRSGVSDAVSGYRYTATAIPQSTPKTKTSRKLADPKVANYTAIHLDQSNFPQFPDVPVVEIPGDSLDQFLSTARTYHLSFSLSVTVGTKSGAATQSDLQAQLAQYFHQNDLRFAHPDVIPDVEPPVVPHSQDWVVLRPKKMRRVDKYEFTVVDTPLASMNNTFLKAMTGKLTEPGRDGRGILFLAPLKTYLFGTLPRLPDLPPAVMHALPAHAAHHCFAWRALVALHNSMSQTLPSSTSCRGWFLWLTWWTTNFANRPSFPIFFSIACGCWRFRNISHEQCGPHRAPSAMCSDVASSPPQGSPVDGMSIPRSRSASPSRHEHIDLTIDSPSPESRPEVKDYDYSCAHSVAARARLHRTFKEHVTLDLCQGKAPRPFRLLTLKERPSYGALFEKLFLDLSASDSGKVRLKLEDAILIHHCSWSGLLSSNGYDWSAIEYVHERSNGPGIEHAFQTGTIDYILERESHWRTIGRYIVPVFDPMGCSATRLAEFRAHGAIFAWTLGRSHVLPSISPFMILAMVSSDPYVVTDLELVRFLDPELYEILKFWPSSSSEPIPPLANSPPALALFHEHLTMFDQPVEKLNQRSPADHRRCTLGLFTKILLGWNFLLTAPAEWDAFKHGFSKTFHPNREESLLTSFPTDHHELKQTVISLIPLSPTIEAFRRSLTHTTILSPLKDMELKERTLDLLLRYLARPGNPTNLPPDTIERLEKSPALRVVDQDPSLLRPHLLAVACFAVPYFPTPKHRIALSPQKVTACQIDQGETGEEYAARIEKYSKYLEGNGCPWTFHTCQGYIDIHVGRHYRQLVNESWKSKDDDNDSAFDLFMHVSLAALKLHDFTLA
ncbi:hypothetical protein EXIGLDRAFT_695324 [Exidia glandulosa HHB12029]|uniref:Uncharacterized protein n=1 Tax=Exidia glandulosa HHB12029 TaxID=1314781 RepID=A0A165FZU1_EXIGL|nr:hypothetical protein EXIGLDRAFT_695324 [Exidia glandulosa HHB12029]